MSPAHQLRGRTHPRRRQFASGKRATSFGRHRMVGTSMANERGVRPLSVETPLHHGPAHARRARESYLVAGPYEAHARLREQRLRLPPVQLGEIRSEASAQETRDLALQG